MMRYLFRVPRFAVLIAIVAIPLLSGIVFSPYAPWKRLRSEGACSFHGSLGQCHLGCR